MSTTTTTTTTAPAYADRWTWEELGSMQEDFPNRILQVSSNIILTITDSSTIQRSTDAGQTWSTVLDIATETPSSAIGVELVHLPLTNSILAIGSFLFTCWKSEDLGATWESVYNAGDVGPFAMVALNNAVVLIGDSDGTVLRSTDGGETWSEHAAATYATMASIGGGKVVAGVSTSGLHRSTDWGQTFINVFTPSDNVRMFLAPSSGHILAIDAGAEVYRSTNFGVNWTKIADINDFGGTSPVTKDAGDMINNYTAIVSMDQEIWGTEDGGFTWELVALSEDIDPTLAGKDATAITYIDNNQFLVGFNSSPKIFKVTRNLPLPETEKGSGSPPSAGPSGIVGEGFGGFGFGWS